MPSESQPASLPPNGLTISVATFMQTEDNYGQLLQAWALKQALISLGHHVTHICHRVTYQQTGEPTLLPPGSPLRTRIRILLSPHSYLLWYRQRRAWKWKQQHLRHFNTYRRQWFTFDPPTDDATYERLQQTPPQADIYLCGSDQIWAGMPANENKTWYLDYGPQHITRVAYAASFGSPQLGPEKTAFITPLLHRFDHISVRESSAQSLCRQAGRDDAIQVLDPTLLLNAQDYLGNMGVHPTASATLLAYILNISRAEECHYKAIRTCARRLRLTLHTVASSGARDATACLPLCDLRAPTPPAWLEEIASAACIITNSFHGTVFAILFHKPFLFISLNGDMNDRITDLLGQLGLQDRLYIQGDMTQQLQAPIDWKQIDQQLDLLRQASFLFLQRALARK